mmetsp:Transcript_301/g.742  ORF Transcript_301/g.742 Transcript_301/m.742 type:complete len:227 (-) Transcript_301:107-787(-)
MPHQRLGLGLHGGGGRGGHLAHPLLERTAALRARQQRLVVDRSHEDRHSHAEARLALRPMLRPMLRPELRPEQPSQHVLCAQLRTLSGGGVHKHATPQPVSLQQVRRVRLEALAHRRAERNALCTAHPRQLREWRICGPVDRARGRWQASYGEAGVERCQICRWRQAGGPGGSAEPHFAACAVRYRRTVAVAVHHNGLREHKVVARGGVKPGGRQVDSRSQPVTDA